VLVVGLALLALILALFLMASVLRGGNPSENASSRGSADPQGAGTPVAAPADDPGGATDEAQETAAPEETTAPEAASEAEEPEETTAAEDEPEKEEAPAPPVQEAADVVYEVYVANAENRFADSWALLSPRYQEEEVGSLEEWTRRNEPIVEVRLGAGITAQEGEDGTARVPVQGSEIRSDGERPISGTWICVNEDGAWRLDRFESG